MSLDGTTPLQHLVAAATPAPLALAQEGSPSVTRHIELVMVQLHEPDHAIEAQDCWRIGFNIGPSYACDWEDARGVRHRLFKRHALMVIPPGAALVQRMAGARAPGRHAKPARLATFRVSAEFHAQCAMALGLPVRDSRPEHQLMPGDDVLRLLAQALLADLQAGSPDGPAATERAAEALIGRLLLRDARRRVVPAGNTMRKVQAHIDANLQSPLALEELAALANMSLFHFCRVFRDSLGATPHQYIVTRRLEQAKRMLWANRAGQTQAQTPMSVLQVTLACGFNSPSHFAAQFKRHTGKTPMQWQRASPG